MKPSLLVKRNIIWVKQGLGHSEMMGARTYARIFATIYIIGFLISGADAQVLPGRIAGTPSGQSFPAINGLESVNSNTDALVGNDTNGPYVLSWKPINRLSEIVTVDGRFMQRDVDYSIDYASGSVTFKDTIKSSNEIRIEYSYDSANAVQNVAPKNVPLTFDIFRKDNAGLQFTTLYKQPAQSEQSAPELTVYGLTGNTKAKQAEFNTMFLFSPEQPDQTGSSFGDRSAMSLGGTTKTDKFQLSTSFVRIGEQFAGAKDFKLQQGLETLDMAAAYTPNANLNISSSMKRTENLIGDKRGEANTTTSHSVVYSPDGAPKLTIARTEVEKNNPGIASQTATTDKVQLEHQMGSRVSAVATHENVSLETGGSQTRLTNDRISVNAKPSDKLSVKAAASRTDVEKTGKESAESIQLVANPSRRFSVEMNLANKDSDTIGSEFAHAVRMISTPSSNLRVELGMAGQSLERQGDESARTLKLSTSALRNTTVKVSLYDKDSELNGPEEFSGLQVEASPAKSIKVYGNVGQRETTDTSELSKSARIEVSPFSDTKLGGGYSEVESNGTVAARITEVNADTKPADFLALSGGYKTRELTGQDDLNSMNVALLLDTGRIFKFTGAYSTNPEDKKGIIQRINSQSIGIKSDLGKLKLKGSVTQKDDYLVGKQSQMTEVALDYRLSSNSLLTTGYSLDEYKETSALQTSVYTLGYTHKVASRLSVYLGGKMTTYESDEAVFSDRKEYEAEARIGIKF